MGSPPHTRGTHTLFQLVVIMIGITPAYAGNTLKEGDLDVYIEDHPRIRGEHSKKIP